MVVLFLKRGDKMSDIKTKDLKSKTVKVIIKQQLRLNNIYIIAKYTLLNIYLANTNVIIYFTNC